MDSATPKNEPPRRASAAGGFASAGDWRRQETEEYLLSASLERIGIN
ncbi:hypothetical protein SAMD00079811_79000 (plasmid) [Scytonema sp. HK-05]|nr:hypothetical protein [Scytonema sp. HK-05]BAY50271.1 hypothetical protein SAMD00079811_79000 [Scytonema sp. HK-05]